MRASDSGIVKLSCYTTIIGYWYNLPVISTGIFGGYNEFRLYDLSFLLLFYVLIFNKRYLIVFNYLDNHRVYKYLFKFTKWSSLMIIPTFISAILYAQYSYIGMTIIFLYHLWGFILLVAFINKYFVKNDFASITRFFLILSTLHLFLYYLQIGGIVGHLWPEVYQEAYGEATFSGSLGPNRITPGMMTFFGFVLGLYSLISKKQLKGVKLLAIINISFAIPVILMIGSRTTFFSLIIFCLVYVIIYARKYIYILFLVIPLILVAFQYIGSAQKAVIIDNFEKNQNKLLQDGNIEDIDLVEGYSNLGSGRKEILDGYIPYLLNNSFIIPFGIGFNNRIYAMENTSAASAHNIYLSLINEVGLFGLFFYLSWLFSYFMVAKGNIAKYGSPHIYGLIIALFVSMVISLFSGEHLYIYRPCFALLGSFIFVNNVILEDRNRGYANPTLLTN